jgi:hypothetical protein
MGSSDWCRGCSIEDESFSFIWTSNDPIRCETFGSATVPAVEFGSLDASD